MKTYLALFVLAAFPALAHAVPYHNPAGKLDQALRSEEGLNIFLTAEAFESGEVGASQINTYEQIQIRVNGSNLFSGAKVRAVLTPNCKSREYGWPVAKPSLVVDLNPETQGSNQNYSASFEGTIIIHSAVHGGESIDCRPQLSVVVDGAWQTDPMNGTHNFNLKRF